MIVINDAYKVNVTLGDINREWFDVVTQAIDDVQLSRRCKKVLQFAIIEITESNGCICPRNRVINLTKINYMQ